MSNRIDNLGKYAKGGPGRPKGSKSGRSKALLEVDKLISKHKNLRLLRIDLQEKFEKDPGNFFIRYIAPFIPKNVTLDLEKDNEISINLNITDGSESEHSD